MSNSKLSAIDLDRIKYLTDIFNSQNITPVELKELEKLQKSWLLNSEIADGAENTQIERSYK
jgi:hypothetical protein